MKTPNPIQILLVEELHAESELVLSELRDAEMHYELEIVSNEESFTNAIKARTFDVILSPYSLKDTNAAKLLTKSKNLGVETPFILLAFDLSEDIAIDLLANGVEDYVLRSTLKRVPVAIRKALQRYKTTLELRLSEAKFKASEASLRNMVKNTPLAVAMFDSQMNYLVVSGTWLANENKKEEDIIGKNHYQVNPNLPEHAKEVHKRCLAGETLYSDEQHIENPDGTVTIIRWKLSPWYDVQPKIGGVVLFKEDITEQVRTKKKLEETATSLAQAQSIAKLGSWEWSLGDELVKLSDQMFEIYEIEPRPIGIKDIREFVHPEDLPKVELVAAKDLTDKIEPVIEYRIITGTGKVKHVISSAKQVISKNGKVQKLIGTLQDVTERKEIEQSLAETNKIFNEIADNVEQAFWVTDRTGDQLLYMSPMYEQIYGGSLDKIYEKNDAWSDNIHPEDKDRVVKSFKENGEKGLYDEEYRIVIEGKTKWVKARAFPITNADGEVVRLAGITQDITARKESKEQIELLSLVASETVNGVLIQDPDYKITWANKGFTRISGFTIEEVLGKDPKDILFGDFTNAKITKLGYDHVRAGKPFRFDNQFKHKSGNPVWLNVTLTPLFNENNQLSNIVIIGTDISKQKEIEDLQARELKRLKRDNLVLKFNKERKN